MALYAEITSLAVTPANPQSGTDAVVTLKVRNKYTAPISILGQFDAGGGPVIYYSSSDRGDVQPNSELVVTGWFTMPNAPVTITGRSYWYGGDGAFHFDDEKIATVTPQEVISGAMISKTIEYDGQFRSIPVDNLSVNQAVRIRVVGKNTSSSAQQLGIWIKVRDKDGQVILFPGGNEFYFDWESGNTAPGDTHEFVAPSAVFNQSITLSKAGDYSVEMALFAYPDKQLDYFNDKLCSVVGLAGSITKKQLEYSGQYSDIPVASIPINVLAKPHIWVRNDTSLGRAMRVVCTIIDPDGIVTDVFDDTNSNVTPGQEVDIRPPSKTFSVLKVGIYRTHIELYMDTTVVANYGTESSPLPICTVATLTGTITSKQVSIAGAAAVDIPTGDVALGSKGVVKITSKNTSIGTVKHKLVITVKDKDGNNLTPGYLTSNNILPSGTNIFSSPEFSFNNTGKYTVAASLYALPDEITPIASFADTKLCNDVPSGHTNKATVNSLKIAGWAKVGGTIAKSVVNLIPGDKLTVRVNINYSSPVADTTNDGTFAQLTYHNDVPPFDHPVAGTTVTYPIPLPATVGNKDLTYDWTITIGSGVETGQYDIKVGIPDPGGPGWEDDTANSFPIRVSSGGGGGTAQIPKDGLSIVSWGKNTGSLGTAPLTLTIGDVLHVKIGIKYSSVADDTAITNVGISYTLGAQIKHIDNEFVSKAVALPMSDALTTAYDTFDIPIAGGAKGGLYNGTYLISAIIPNPFPGWAIDTAEVLTMAGGTDNEQPSPIPGLGDIGGLIGMMIVMMIMSVMMRFIEEPGKTAREAVQIIMPVLPGGGVAKAAGGIAGLLTGPRGGEE